MPVDGHGLVFHNGGRLIPGRENWSGAAGAGRKRRPPGGGTVSRPGCSGEMVLVVTAKSVYVVDVILREENSVQSARHPRQNRTGEI